MSRMIRILLLAAGLFLITALVTPSPAEAADCICSGACIFNGECLECGFGLFSCFSCIRWHCFICDELQCPYGSLEPSDDVIRMAESRGKALISPKTSACSGNPDSGVLPKIVRINRTAART